MTAPTPPVAVLCGSVTRSVDALDAAERWYRAQGYTVHKPVRDDGVAFELHVDRWYALIDTADLVVACTMQHQPVGEQTRREMERAFAADIPVRLWVEASPLPAIMRPNGKTYQPRKITVEIWDNDSDSLHAGDDYGVVVLGTHDIAVAQVLADDEIARRWDSDLSGVEACAGWFRDSFRHGARTWVNDPERGRAGVWFRADYPAEERAS